ncbi:MAG: hypothetical protein ACTJFS_15050 [Micrococcaceae bacterium]
MNEIEKEALAVSADRHLAGDYVLPEAVEAASVQHRRTRAVIDPTVYRGRGVEWVRPTDLISRASSRVAGAGINFQTELRRRTFEVTAASARGIADRARHLPPLSAFGHGNSRHGAERGAIGTH